MGAAGRARALALLDPGAQARRQIEIYEHVASLGQLAAAPPAV
jgi:hypothetical protein